MVSFSSMAIYIEATCSLRWNSRNGNLIRRLSWYLYKRIHTNMQIHENTNMQRPEEIYCHSSPTTTRNSWWRTKRQHDGKAWALIWFVSADTETRSHRRQASPLSRGGLALSRWSRVPTGNRALKRSSAFHSNFPTIYETQQK